MCVGHALNVFFFVVLFFVEMMIVYLVHFDISFPSDETVIASLAYLGCLASR